INDLVDLKKDQKHPDKRNRPITSGQVGSVPALILGLSLTLVGITSAYFLNLNFFYAAVVYSALMHLYTFALKDFIILDLFIVAFGYVLRAAGGALVIGVEISSWLLICTFLIALFLIMAKRRHEILLVESPEVHRSSLSGYSPILLDQMISVVTSATVVSYSFYTLSEQTVSKFGTRNLVFTIPIVIYGIFRYLYIVYKKEGAGAPEIAVVKDKPLLLSLLVWVIAILLILTPRF
ncbi:MAG TPA: decaprenyl-phosphate phosphoribosyltransferase, partial [bacterium (Candidatus Stahlbacteria)]|nr:decaprenyl-phosphate phosphoribosyltransferase [Candidatus Stahlbacteria bacterium]